MLLIFSSQRSQLFSTAFLKGNDGALVQMQKFYNQKSVIFNLKIYTISEGLYSMNAFLNHCAIIFQAAWPEVISFASLCEIH